MHERPQAPIDEPESSKDTTTMGAGQTQSRPDTIEGSRTALRSHRSAGTVRTYDSKRGWTARVHESPFWE